MTLRQVSVQLHVSQRARYRQSGFWPPWVAIGASMWKRINVLRGIPGALGSSVCLLTSVWSSIGSVKGRECSGETMGTFLKNGGKLDG
jgi:hypothetical protein